MERVHVSNHPLILHKLSLLRDVNTKPKKFRELVRELAILLAYEATADMALGPVDVVTPMGETKGQTLREKIGLVPILRAGLGMVEGVWEMMPGAEVWHIGLYRDERTLRPVEYYNKLPVDPTVQGRGYGEHPQKMGCSAHQVRGYHRRPGGDQGSHRDSSRRGHPRGSRGRSPQRNRLHRPRPGRRRRPTVWHRLIRTSGTGDSGAKWGSVE